MRIRFVFNIMKLFVQYYHETSLCRYNDVKKDIDRVGASLELTESSLRRRRV